MGGEVEQGGIKKCYSDVYHHSASHQDRASCTRQGRGPGGKIATHTCRRCKMLRPSLLSLLELAYRGDARVACLIARGADVNQTGDDSVGGTVSPLLVASHQGHCEVVRVLLSANANVNQARDDGKSPLFVASQQGHCEVVRQLLSANASVNRANNEGVSPLFAASYQGHCDVVQVLLFANANVNQAEDKGASPLLAASNNGHCDVAQALLFASANVNQARDDGVNPLFMASQNGHCDVAQALLSANATVNTTTDFGGTALMASSNYGHAPIVRLLLKHRAEPNTRNPQYESFTALHFAATAGHRAIANLLAKRTVLGAGELAELCGEGMGVELRAKLKLRQCAGCERLQLLGEKKFKRCAGCGSVAFCARACQVKHWKGHKAACRKDAEGAAHI